MLKQTILFTLFFISLGALIVLSTGCKKNDGLNTSPAVYLSFSTTLVEFDTVFTTVGSSTHIFTVHNPNKQAVNISEIRLQGGAGSNFRININGAATTDFKDLRLAAGDSIFMFAEVTINPNAANLPFIVTDTILFTLNGHTQKVALQAFGQNAHFIKNEILSCGTVFHNDGIPIVLYDTAYVKPNCTLTIDTGVTIYCHRNALLLINGTLICNGTVSQPVIFRQDRLEQAYLNQPGQWNGISFLNSSVNNTLTHTILEEGNVGIEVDSLSYTNTPKLTLNSCTIKNMRSDGLACFGATVNATNTLIYSSGLYNIYCGLGGTYNFINCDFDIINDAVANRVPSVHLDNQIYKNINGKAFPLDLKASFYNCIIWGDLDDEVELINLKNDTTPAKFDTLFSHNIIKAKKVKFGSINLVNQNQYFPGFINEGGIPPDYHLQSTSPAINAGSLVLGFPVVIDDIEGKMRTNINTPDIGCYKY